MIKDSERLIDTPRIRWKCSISVLLLPTGLRGAVSRGWIDANWRPMRCSPTSQGASVPYLHGNQSNIGMGP